MKKLITTGLLFFTLVGCNTYQEVESDETTRTITTEQAGHLQINKTIKKPVLFRAADPLNAELLGVPPAGINSQLEHTDLVKEKLNGEFITPGDTDKVKKLNPDLIVTYAPDEYSSEYGDIAPTIEMRYITSAFSPYKKRIYLTHFYYLGVILNKEEEAKTIADDFLEKIPKLRRELNEQVTDKNAAVILEENNKYYLRPEFTSYGTEAVFDILGFKQPKYIKRILESDDSKVYVDEDYSSADLDYLFVATEDLDNKEKQAQLAKAFNIDDAQIIYIDMYNFRPNDLQSIEYQAKTIIDKLNNK